MEPLLPIDARSIPATVARLSNITSSTTQARIIGPPPDLEQPVPPVKLERLWLQNMKPDVAEALALRFDPVQLSLTNVQTADLDWVGKLTRLRELLIEWNTKLESFAFLRHTQPLVRLRGDGLKRVNRLDDLVHQPTLKWLWIGGGIDRRLEVASLEPLAQLVELEQLFLITIRLEDRSLTPLAKLRNLRRLRIQSNAAHMEDYARLAAALPGVESDALRGFKTLRRNLPQDVDLLEVLDELVDDERVIMVGEGGRMFKAATQRDKIVDQLQRFRAIRDAERARLSASERG